jgi:hypothetical protein
MQQDKDILYHIVAVLQNEGELKFGENGKAVMEFPETAIKGIITKCEVDLKE